MCRLVVRRTADKSRGTQRNVMCPPTTSRLALLLSSHSASTLSKPLCQMPCQYRCLDSRVFVRVSVLSCYVLSDFYRDNAPSDCDPSPPIWEEPVCSRRRRTK